MLYFSLFLVFLTVVFTVVGIYNFVFSKRIEVVNRLDIYTRDADSYTDNDISFKEYILKMIGSVTNVLSKKSFMEDKKKKLNQAYVFMRVEEFLAISVLVAVTFALLLYLASKSWIVALIGLIIGIRIPDIFVNSIKKKRMKKLNHQLPDALSIISNGLRAGFSFTQAMSVAASELESPIKDEFLRVIRDNSIGKTLEEALISFSERTDDEDIDMFITALIIQRKVGGNLTEVLDTIAATIRDRMRIRGEVKTLTAQGRLSAMIISFLPFGVALFIFISNPSYIMELFNSTIGIIMVAGAVIMQIVGMLIIMKMANIEI